MTKKLPGMQFIETPWASTAASTRRCKHRAVRSRVANAGTKSSPGTLYPNRDLRVPATFPFSGISGWCVRLLDAALSPSKSFGNCSLSSSTPSSLTGARARSRSASSGSVGEQPSAMSQGSRCHAAL